MYLFNNLGIYPYYGAITSTVIGYMFSLGIPLIALYKKDNLSYKDTFKKIPRLMITLGVYIIICLVYKNYVTLPHDSFLYICVYLGIIGVISTLIYILLNFKLLKELLLTKDK